LNSKRQKETERIGNLFEDLFLEAEEEPKIILKIRIRRQIGKYYRY
jgi:hypothetical protein